MQQLNQVIVASSLLHFVFRPYISGNLSKLDYFYSICLLAFTLFGMAFSMFTEYDINDPKKVVHEGQFPKDLDWLKDYLDYIAVNTVILALSITCLDINKELFKKYKRLKALHLYMLKAIKGEYSNAQGWISKRLSWIQPLQVEHIAPTSAQLQNVQTSETPATKAQLLKSFGLTTRLASEAA